MLYTPLGIIYKVPHYLYEAMINTFRGMSKILRERYEELLIFDPEGGATHIKNPGIAAEWFRVQVDRMIARSTLITPENANKFLKPDQKQLELNLEGMLESPKIRI